MLELKCTVFLHVITVFHKLSSPAAHLTANFCLMERGTIYMAGNVYLHTSPCPISVKTCEDKTTNVQ